MTKNEKELLRAIIESENQDSDDVIENPIWVGCWDTSLSTQSIPGVMASLSKKGFVETDGETCYITQTGFQNYVEK